jgi:uncharacterized protein (TIGR02246 family)
MKPHHAFALFFSVIAAACAEPPPKPAAQAPAPTASAEEAIRALGRSFDAAWQKKDPRARAGLFAEDATLINPFGMRADGRPAIEKVFTVETATIANGTTHRFGQMKVKFLDPDNALVDADNAIDGLKTPDGKEAPPLEYHLVAVASRAEGGWRWSAGRPYAFMPPPAQSR